MSVGSLNSDAFVAIASGEDAITSKRREARQRVLLRAELHVVDIQSDVLVTDLSRSGLRGMTDLSLSIGQTVFVSLDDLTHCSGTVRWTEGRRFGIKFNCLLDVLPENTVTDTGQMPDHQERMLRTPTNFKAKICLCVSSCRAKIRNVSKSGMMVETDLPMRKCQKLLVKLSDGKILNADVRWVEGERVGVQLSSPVSILRFTYGDLN